MLFVLQTVLCICVCVCVCTLTLKLFVHFIHSITHAVGRYKYYLNYFTHTIRSYSVRFQI